MPDIVSSGAVLGRRGHAVSATLNTESEIIRAAPTTPACGTQLGQHDRQVPGRQGQRAAVDDAAHLGEQRMAEAGRDLAADDDQPGLKKLTRPASS